MNLEVDPSLVKPSDEIAAPGNTLIVALWEECTQEEGWMNVEWTNSWYPPHLPTDDGTPFSLPETPWTQPNHPTPTTTPTIFPKPSLTISRRKDPPYPTHCKDVLSILVKYGLVLPLESLFSSSHSAYPWNAKVSLLGLGSLLPMFPAILTKISALTPQALIERNLKEPQSGGILAHFHSERPPQHQPVLENLSSWSSSPVS